MGKPKIKDIITNVEYSLFLTNDGSVYKTGIYGYTGINNVPVLMADTPWNGLHSVDKTNGALFILDNGTVYLREFTNFILIDKLWDPSANVKQVVRNSSIYSDVMNDSFVLLDNNEVWYILNNNINFKVYEGDTDIDSIYVNDHSIVMLLENGEYDAIANTLPFQYFGE